MAEEATAAAQQVHLDPLHHRLQLERHEAELQLLYADTVCANALALAQPVPWCADPFSQWLFYVAMTLLTIDITSVRVDRSKFATYVGPLALGANEAPRTVYEQVARSLRVLYGFQWLLARSAGRGTRTPVGSLNLL